MPHLCRLYLFSLVSCVDSMPLHISLNGAQINSIAVLVCVVLLVCGVQCIWCTRLSQCAMYSHTYTHIHTHVHTRTHIHTHTHTHISRVLLLTPRWSLAAIYIVALAKAAQPAVAGECLKPTHIHSLVIGYSCKSDTPLHKSYLPLPVCVCARASWRRLTT